MPEYTKEQRIKFYKDVIIYIKENTDFSDTKKEKTILKMEKEIKKLEKEE